MRQALIVTNPKWELFTTVSDKFKALSGDAVLVVRGRGKEKKLAKIKQLAKNAAAAAACILMGLTLSASAQQNILNNLSAPVIVAATTNAGIGVGVIGWNIDQVAIIQQTIVTTNNGVGLTNSLTKTFDTSDNGTDWVLNQYTFATLLNKTTNSTSITRITNTAGAKYIRLGEDRNTNSNAVQTVRLTLSIKEH